jgi:hypothetical protein
MAYLLLIVEPRDQRETRTEDEARGLFADMVRFGESLAARGLLRATESLCPDKHGVRVQIRDNESQLRDGPFAEAKEMVGGFLSHRLRNKSRSYRHRQPVSSGALGDGRSARGRAVLRGVK